MDTSPRATLLLPVFMLVCGLAYVSTRPNPTSPLTAEQTSSSQRFDSHQERSGAMRSGGLSGIDKLEPYPRETDPLAQPIKIPVANLLERMERMPAVDAAAGPAHSRPANGPLAGIDQADPRIAQFAPPVAAQSESTPPIDAPVIDSTDVAEGSATSASDRSTDDEQATNVALRAEGQRPYSAEQLQAAASQVARLLENGKRFAERGALYSARSEFRRALNVSAEALDAADRGERRLALDRAFIAFEESAEFEAMNKRKRSAKVASLVLAHDTPVLHGVECAKMPLRVAMEKYFEYAQEQLVAALRGAPLGADGLFLLGKLHKSSADARPVETLDAPMAMAYYQAAMTVEPRHHYAANELGVMLAHYGQWTTAKQVLVQSVQSHASVEAWSNLAKVHLHLGEQELAQLANNEARMIAQKRYSAPPTRASRDINQVVTWVAPQQFSRMAPANSPAPASTRVAPPMMTGGVGLRTPARMISNTANSSGQATRATSPQRSTSRATGGASPWRQPR